MSTVVGRQSATLARRVVLLALLFFAFAPPRSAGAESAAEQALRQELEATRAQLSSTRQELQETRGAVAELTRRVDAMQAAGAVVPLPGAPSEATARLAPVNANNPAISFAVDVKGASNTGDGGGAGFDLGTAELFLSAPIDPFLRGYASIVGTTEGSFDLEEAALVTTALPGNLVVKGGRFFADVGRLSKWHEEALPFAYRPRSIDRIVGGESGAEGVELSWLAPTDTFLQLHTGIYNSIGSELREAGGVFSGKRSWSELTYLARPSAYFDVTDRASIELGGTWFQQPHRSNRRVFGVDVTLRDQPGTNLLYNGTTLGIEWMWSQARGASDAPLIDVSTGQPVLDDEGNARFGEGVFQRQGGYGYFETFFAQRWSAGALLDYSEAPVQAPDRTRTYAGFLTWRPSEFQRLRAQIEQIIGADTSSDQRFTLQWTAFLGSHSHGFATR